MSTWSQSSALIQRLFPQSRVSGVSQWETFSITGRLARQIRRGFLAISDHRSDYNNFISHNTKEDALKKIFHSDDYYNYERDYRIMLNLPEPKIQRKRSRKRVIKEEEGLLRKKSAEEIKREFIQKKKEWEKQKSRLSKQRRQGEMKRQLLENSSEEKKKRDDEDIQQFLRLEKRKVLEGRIKDIQGRKVQRYEHLQQSQIRHSQSLPKYIEYQNRFKSEQLRKSLERQILIKNRKHSLQIDMQQIKQHQKAYIQRIKDRLNIKANNSNKSFDHLDNSRQQNFTLHKKDAKQMRKLQQKLKKVRKFEQKVRLIPLKIDSEKKKEMLILNDKQKNHKKYNFLSQKALSDQQIFDNFKEFDININKKEVGKQYLNQIRENNRYVRRKVTSEEVLPANRPQYKNYLDQLKSNRKKVLNPDQYDNYAQNMKSKKYREHGKDLLRQQSQLFERKAIQNIRQLKNSQGYLNSVQKQEQIDDYYSRALKAKLALAKIN